MRKYKYIKKAKQIGLCLLLALFFVACNKDEKAYDFPGTNINKVFSRSPSSLVKGHDKAFFAIVKTPAGISLVGSLKFPVYSTLKTQSDVRVKMFVDNSLVDLYNQTEKTELKALPPNVLSLKNEELTILSNSSISKDSVEVMISTTIDPKSLPVGKYLVSIVISEVVGGNVVISSNRNRIHIIIDVTEDTDNIDDTSTIQGALLAGDRSNWTVTTVNSSFSGNTAILFDGDLDRDIRYGVTSYDDTTGFTVDMQQVYANISGIYQIFYSPMYRIRKSDIYTSVDGTTWTHQGSFSNPGDQISNIMFYAPVQARYVKTIVREAGRIYIRELNIYVKQ